METLVLPFDYLRRFGLDTTLPSNVYFWSSVHIYYYANHSLTPPLTPATLQRKGDECP